MIEMLSEADAYDMETKSQREGSQAAQTEFMASLINVPDSALSEDLKDRISGNVDCYFNIE